MRGMLRFQVFFNFSADFQLRLQGFCYYSVGNGLLKLNTHQASEIFRALRKTQF